MADEKEPGPIVEADIETDTDTDTESNVDDVQVSPWETAPDTVTDSVTDAETDAAVTDDTVVETAATDDEPVQKKSGSGRGILWLLAVLIIIGGGLYVSWPTLQPRLLGLLPQATTEAATEAASQAVAALEALRALDHRVAQLEAANARFEEVVATLKETIDDYSTQIADLAKGIGDSDVLAGMGGKLAALEQTLAQLGQQAGESGAAAMLALSAEVDAMKARLAEQNVASGQAEAAATQDDIIALKVENKALRESLGALEARMAQLEDAMQQSAQARQKVGAGEGLVLAMGQLRQSVLAGRPYEQNLVAVTALVGDDAALQQATKTLVPWSEEGVVTLRALSDQFPAMARAVLQADPAGAGGFWRRTLHRITSLVTIRRVGEVEGGDVDAVLARAERRLASGELAAAADLVAALDGPPGEAAQAWLG
ncbi:MAG: hypothetical protein HN394_20475, partial [Rhodospirillaceae bacterium]|nr:hypothetical protein [Rhodospirillaceae bacterium]